MSNEKIIEASSIVKVRTLYRGERLNYGGAGYSKVFLLIRGKIKIATSDDMDNDMIKDISPQPRYLVTSVSMVILPTMSLLKP